MKKSDISLKELAELAKEIKKLPSAEFKNEYGEKFVIYSNGVNVLMSGDEINAMIDPKNAPHGIMSLFNDHFNVWSPAELFQLGKVLQTVGEKNMSERDKTFVSSIST